MFSELRSSTFIHLLWRSNSSRSALFSSPTSAVGEGGSYPNFNGRYLSQRIYILSTYIYMDHGNIKIGSEWPKKIWPGPNIPIWFVCCWCVPFNGEICVLTSGFSWLFMPQYLQVLGLFRSRNMHKVRVKARDAGARWQIVRRGDGDKLWSNLQIITELLPQDTVTSSPHIARWYTPSLSTRVVRNM